MLINQEEVERLASLAGIPVRHVLRKALLLHELASWRGLSTSEALVEYARMDADDLYHDIVLHRHEHDRYLSYLEEMAWLCERQTAGVRESFEDPRSYRAPMPWPGCIRLGCDNPALFDAPVCFACAEEHMPTASNGRD